MGGGSFGAGFVGSATAATSSGFIAGGVTGMASGFVGGLVNGAGQGWIQNQSFEESLNMGLQQGVIGGVAGMAVGGIFGGAKALVDKRSFWTGDHTFRQKSNMFFDYHREELIDEFGEEVIETTTFKGKRFMRAHGITEGLDVDPSDIFRTDHQTIYIARKDLNAWYYGTNDQIGTPKLFHEVFHASDFHKGIPESWFAPNDNYYQQMVEFRAYTYEFNKFHTTGSAKYLSLYIPYNP